MQRRLVVCKCGKAKFGKNWLYSALPLSSFIREVCGTKEPNVIITLVITKCDKCLII